MSPSLPNRVSDQCFSSIHSDVSSRPSSTTLHHCLSYPVKSCLNFSEEVEVAHTSRVIKGTIKKSTQ